MAQILGTNPSFRGKDDRSNAWTITCDYWESQGVSPLILPINPESLELRFPITGAEVTMYGGKVVPVKRNPRTGSVFDYPTLAIKFNSGNVQPAWSEEVATNTQETNVAAAYTAAGDYLINSTSTQTVWSDSSLNQVRGSRGANTPRGLLPSPVPSGWETDNVYGAFDRVNNTQSGANMVSGLYATNRSIPVGIQNLYALLAMFNSQWMVPVREANLSGQHKSYNVLNRIKLTTSTLAFPSLIFYGFPTEEGLQWSETADNFNNFDTSFSMIVTNTNPHLGGHDLKSMFSVYKTKIFAPTSVFDADPATIKIDTLGPGDGGTCPDTGDGETKTEDPEQKAKEPTLLDRINGLTKAVNGFDNKYFGNPNIENATGGPTDAAAGLLRNSLAAGLTAGSSDIDYYAQAAIAKVDPAFAELARKQLQDTGRGITNATDLATARMAAKEDDSKGFFQKLNGTSSIMGTGKSGAHIG